MPPSSTPSKLEDVLDGDYAVEIMLLVFSFLLVETLFPFLKTKRIFLPDLSMVMRKNTIASIISDASLFQNTDAGNARAKPSLKEQSELCILYFEYQ